ncbi:MAG TPA: hypothetical protein VFQ45_18530 [Longimicrobium sp.]|nr:hypothetical protein [Longimicrobium sp.]
MYTLLRSVPLRQVLLQAAPSGAAALVVAEQLYKWHSFTLECAGFLATWAAFDLAIAGVRALVARARPAPTR